MKHIKFLGTTRPSLTKNKVYEIIDNIIICDDGILLKPNMSSTNWKDVTHDFLNGSKTRPHLRAKKK